ncbi:uncharacterized protein I206_106601 [Kwoniella pini CBS 10737]|uniref:Uncharacterized protein n=1 Tax=Kwoniella pini CBS 10737 TaxID=1296096 RepID=A0A1B9HTR6_9TREE|nr:uncharacterized protein I206_07508 [Kwoniella pini CBS 10737]OCF46655.1 hypothetical protein I206_07508 [Kwoniella pini CBS 10737]
MQGRSIASGPSTEYHPPIQTSIPLSSINTLIPRLTTTINDIDNLRNLIGSGYTEGTLPSWDNLLQRYSLLLGRINSLTNYLIPSSSSTNIKGNNKSLSEYLIHPLNSISINSEEEISSPFLNETFLQVINTQLLSTTTTTTSSFQTNSIIKKSDSESNSHSHYENNNNNTYHNLEELKKLNEFELENLKKQLNLRLNKENNKILNIKREIEKQKEEIDWTMRIGEEEEDDDEEDDQHLLENANGKQKEKEKDNDAADDDVDDDDDDLFGGDEEEEEDEPMIIDVDAEKLLPMVNNDQQQDKNSSSHSQKDWKLEDYIIFMDSGKLPIPTSNS